MYSSPVTVDTPATVTATYQGTFAVGLITVIPWLQQLSLTPTSIVGGNSLTGRITLAALPPTGSGGIAVNVLTDSPKIVTFKGGSTVTVPEGQTSVTFEIDTVGVGTISFPQITASLLGVGEAQTLTVTLANLLNLTFNPPTVAGGTTSMGTLTLDGQATGPFTVELSSQDPSYVINTGNTDPHQLIFTAGSTQQTFSITPPYEGSNTQSLITATRGVQLNYTAESTSATLFVKSAVLTTLQVSPNPVPGGTPSQGTVIIGSAAPTGGVIVAIQCTDTTGNPSTVAAVPPTVTIPAGATSAVFPIQTFVIANTTAAKITATYGASQSQILTVTGVTYTMTLAPTSVVGGPTGISTGTITLPANAPAGGLTFQIASSDYGTALFQQPPAVGAAIFVTVPGGASSVTFPVYTNSIAQQETVTITASLGGVAQANPPTLTVLPVSVIGMTFSPATVSQRSPRNTTRCTITLSGPAPANGFITLSSSVAAILNVPPMVAISAGQSTVSFNITANANSASRTLATTVTGTYGGQTVSGVVTVTR